jgi:hypothetical protein
MESSGSKAWTSITALLVYMSINVVAAAAHHHAPDDAIDNSHSVLVSDTDLEDGDHDCDHDDDDQDCLVCSVVHLAQGLPALVSLDAGSMLTEQTTAQTPIRRSAPLQSVIRSRAPPQT